MPETLDEIAEAMASPLVQAAYTDISYSHGQFSLNPLAGDTLTGAVPADHDETIATLKAASEELMKLADRNQLGPDDADVYATYIARLGDTPPNPRILHMFAAALEAEIRKAIKEDRLHPGSQVFAAQFISNHHRLIKTYYPEVLAVDPAADAIPMREEPTPDTLAEPLRDLNSVLREEAHLISAELREVFETLDRVREGFERRRMLDQIEDAEEEQRLLRRFVKKTVATIERLVLRLKEVALLDGLSEDQKDGVRVGLLSTLVPILEKLMKLLPSLFG
ncbi:MAG: hypothetical protein AAF415_20035 [Pseudomonadota bacterium]